MLLQVMDGEILGLDLYLKIIVWFKDLLGYVGIIYVDGMYESGLDVVCYVNVFFGIFGDYCVWIGGICVFQDVMVLLDNL